MSWVSADEQKLMGPPPVRQGDSYLGRRRYTGRNPRDDLGLDPGFTQSIEFFSSAPEDRRIATLETDHHFAGRRKPY
jgi:hypothetical protein